MIKLLILLFPVVCFSQANDTLCIKCLQIDPHHTTAIGFKSEARLSKQYDSTAVGGGQLAVGAFAKAFSWRSQAFGDYAIAGSTSATSVGYGAFSAMPHGIAIGRGAYLPKLPHDIYNTLSKGSPVVIGTDSYDFGLGNWWGHKFKKLPSGTQAGNKVPSQITLFYHGQDAYDDTTNEVNVSGGHIGIAAGRGTGGGVGGEIRFYTAPVKALSGNSKNVLSLTGKITVNGYVPFKVTTVQMLALKNVEEGTHVWNTSLRKPCWYDGSDWWCNSSDASIVCKKKVKSGII